MTKPAKFISYSVIVIGIVCLPAQLAFTYWLIGNRPTTPDATAGYTQQISNHGSIRYVTANEKRFLNLLEIPAIVAVAAIVVVGWNRRREKPG